VEVNNGQFMLRFSYVNIVHADCCSLCSIQCKDLVLTASVTAGRLPVCLCLANKIR
jgi:hypothetical protein